MESKKNDLNKNQNQNSKPQDENLNREEENTNQTPDKLSELENKFHQQLKDTEDQLDQQFEEEWNKNFDSNTSNNPIANSDATYKENPMKNSVPPPVFKNAYTEKLDAASKKRETALQKGSNKYIKYSSIGAEMIGSVLLGGYGGNWLDKKMDLGFPLFTILLILLGLAATFTHLIMQLNADRKEEEENNSKNK